MMAGHTAADLRHELVQRRILDEATAMILTPRRAGLVASAGCVDCGVQAGEECRPDYGCTDGSRRRHLEVVA